MYTKHAKSNRIIRSNYRAMHGPSIEVCTDFKLRQQLKKPNCTFVRPCVRTQVVFLSPAFYLRQQLKKPICPFVCTQVVFLSPATFGNLWQLMATYGSFATLQLCIQTSWTDQLDGLGLYIWSLGQFAYLKIDVSVCILSQLPSPTKALFSDASPCIL